MLGELFGDDERKEDEIVFIEGEISGENLVDSWNKCIFRFIEKSAVGIGGDGLSACFVPYLRIHISDHQFFTRLNGSFSKHSDTGE